MRSKILNLTSRSLAGIFIFILLQANFPVQAQRRSSQNNLPQSTYQGLFDGKLDIQQGSGEFVTYTNRWQFETPKKIRMLWYETDEVYQSAKWELFLKDANQPSGRKLLLSIPIENLPRTAGKNVFFDIDLTKKIPKTNQSNKNVEYLIHVVGTPRNNPQLEKRTPIVLLTHLSQSNITQPKATNPYSCKNPSINDKKYDRLITLQIQNILANQTTSTFNEGKDEVYFKVKKRKDNTLYNAERRPWPGKDHFSISQGKVTRLGELLDIGGSNEFVSEYLNLDDRAKLTYINLAHGEAAVVTVNIQEDDAQVWHDLKNGLKIVTGAFEKAFDVAQLKWGAGAVAGFEHLFVNTIPDIEDDDFLGTFSVMFDNRCGFIRTVWLAANRIDIKQPNGVKQKFSFVKSSGSSQKLQSIHNTADILPTVMYTGEGLQGFNPSGWNNYDFGEFITPPELQKQNNVTWSKSEMVLSTWGTSDSSYDFKLKAFVRMPK